LIRFILLLVLIYVGYLVAKLLFKSINSSSGKTIHNSRPRKRESNYDNVQDAEFREIKPDEDKKNN